MKHVIVLRKKSDGTLLAGQALRLHPGTDTTKYSDGQGNDDTTEAASLYTDNNDGTYYKTITKSKQYSVTVSGSAQDELTGIWISGDDMVTEALLGGDFVKESGVFRIADDAVTAAKLKDDASVDANRAVTTNHMRDSAVTTAKIADNAITNAKIADNAVQTVQIQDNTITNAKMANDSVNTAEIVDDAVAKEKINADVAGKGLAQDTDGSLKVDPDTVDFELDTGGKLALKDQASGYTEQNYVKDNRSIFRNLDYLDQIIKVLSTGLNRRVFYADRSTEVADNTNAGNVPEYEEHTSTTGKVKIRALVYIRNTDTKITVHYKTKADENAETWFSLTDSASKDLSISINNINWTEKSGEILLTSYAPGLYEFLMVMAVEGGPSPTYHTVKDVIFEIE